MFRNKKRGSFFFTMLVSFLLFAAIPTIALTCFFLTTVTNTIQDQVTDRSLQNLSIVALNLEQQLNAIVTQFFSATFESEFQDVERITMQNYNSDGDHIYEVIEVAEILSTIRDASSLVSSVYYIDFDNDILITSEKRVAEASTYVGATELVAIGSFDSLTILSTPQIDTSALLYGDVEVVDTITLVLPFSPYSNNHNKVLVAMIHEETLYALLEEYQDSLNASVSEENYAYVFLANEEGTILSSGYKEDVGTSFADEEVLTQIFEAQQDAGFFNATISHDNQGVQSIVAYIRSDTLSMTCVAVYPMSTFYQVVSYMRLLLFVLGAALLVIAAFGSYWLARRIYGSVEDILQTLDYKLDKVQIQDKNELKIISKLVHSIAETELQIETLLESKQLDLQKLAFLREISGHPEDDSLEGILHDNYFVCLYFTMHTVQNDATTSSAQDVFTQKQLLVSSCDQIIASLVGGFAVSLNNGAFAALVMVTPAQAKNLFEATNNLYYQIDAYLSEFNLTCNMGVGEVYHQRADVRISFSEAKEALNYKFVYQYAKPIFYFEIEDRVDKYYYPQTALQCLSNYIAALDQDNFEDELQNLFNLLRTEPMSYGNAGHILYSILDAFVYYLFTNHIEMSEIIDTDEHFYRKVTRFENLDEIDVLFRKIFYHIVAYQKDNDLLRQKYFDKIQSSLANNFRNHAVDVNFIAQDVGLSYSHLRKKFKEYFNCSFSDYINRLRIEEAKRLLRETDTVMERISEEVGFNNYQSFSRAFKKYEGVAPGQYRELSMQ